MNTFEILTKYHLMKNGKINVNAQRMLLKMPDVEAQLRKILSHTTSTKHLLHDAARNITSAPICICGKNLKVFETRGSGKYVSCSRKCGVLMRIAAQGEEGLSANAAKRHLTLSNVGADGLTGYQRMQKKRISTNMASGWFINPADAPKAKLYRQKCWQITYQQPLHTLENFHLRGRAGIPNAHHIDHMVSVNFGFLNDVDPAIIGNIKNLRMIPYRENIAKGPRCSITLDELLKSVEC
jgi:hypothetical protein